MYPGWQTYQHGYMQPQYPMVPVQQGQYQWPNNAGFQPGMAVPPPQTVPPGGENPAPPAPPSEPAPPPPSDDKPPLPPEPPPPDATDSEELAPKDPAEIQRLQQLQQQAAQWQHTQQLQQQQGVWAGGQQQQQQHQQQQQQQQHQQQQPQQHQQQPQQQHQQQSQQGWNQFSGQTFPTNVPPPQPSTAAPPPMQSPMDLIKQEEADFNVKYQQWKNQYDEWREQNKSHPNKDQFRQYLEQWQMYEKQMEDKKADIQKRKSAVEISMPPVPPPVKDSPGSFQNKPPGPGPPAGPAGPAGPGSRDSEGSGQGPQGQGQAQQSEGPKSGQDNKPQELDQAQDMRPGQGPRMQGSPGQGPRTQGPPGQGPRMQGHPGQGPRMQGPPGQGPRMQGPPGQTPRFQGQGPRQQGPQGQGPRQYGPQGQRPRQQGPQGQDPRQQEPHGQGPMQKVPEGQEPWQQGHQGQDSWQQRPQGRGPTQQGPRQQGPQGQGIRQQAPQDQGIRQQWPHGQGPRQQGPQGQGPRQQGPRQQGPQGQGPRQQGPQGQGPRPQGPKSEMGSEEANQSELGHDEQGEDDMVLDDGNSPTVDISIIEEFLNDDDPSINKFMINHLHDDAKELVTSQPKIYGKELMTPFSRLNPVQLNRYVKFINTIGEEALLMKDMGQALTPFILNRMKDDILKELKNIVGDKESGPPRQKQFGRGQQFDAPYGEGPRGARPRFGGPRFDGPPGNMGPRGRGMGPRGFGPRGPRFDGPRYGGPRFGGPWEADQTDSQYEEGDEEDDQYYAQDHHGPRHPGPRFGSQQGPRFSRSGPGPNGGPRMGGSRFGPPSAENKQERQVEQVPEKKSGPPSLMSLNVPELPASVREDLEKKAKGKDQQAKETKPGEPKESVKPGQGQQKPPESASLQEKPPATSQASTTVPPNPQKNQEQQQKQGPGKPPGAAPPPPPPQPGIQGSQRPPPVGRGRGAPGPRFPGAGPNRFPGPRPPPPQVDQEQEQYPGDDEGMEDPYGQMQQDRDRMIRGEGQFGNRGRGQGPPDRFRDRSWNRNDSWQGPERGNGRGRGRGGRGRGFINKPNQGDYPEEIGQGDTGADAAEEDYMEEPEYYRRLPPGGPPHGQPGRELPYRGASRSPPRDPYGPLPPPLADPLSRYDPYRDPYRDDRLRDDPYWDRRDPYDRRDRYPYPPDPYERERRRHFLDDPLYPPRDEFEDRYRDLYKPVSEFKPVETIDYGHKPSTTTSSLFSRGEPAKPVVPTIIDYGHGQTVDDRAAPASRQGSQESDRQHRDTPPERGGYLRRQEEAEEEKLGWERDRDRDRSRQMDRDYRTPVFESQFGRPPPPVPAPKPVVHEPKVETVKVEDILCSPGRTSRPSQIVVIVRGLPGSGKTYVSKLIKDKEVANGGSAPRMLCLDDYFMIEVDRLEKDIETGKRVKKKVLEYEYEADMESAYRQNMLKSFKKTIDDGFFPFIIVDAVFDRVKHFEEFWGSAKSKGFQVYVAEPQADVSTCAKRNTHNRQQKEIERIQSKWDEAPKHYIRLDIRSLLQEDSITEVEMEDMEKTPVKEEEPSVSKEEVEEEEEDDIIGYKKSRWELDLSEGHLDTLDGIHLGKKRQNSPQSMDEFLQLADEYFQRQQQDPSKKRVRWADLEERKQQNYRRELGFVVGQTQRDWERITDDSFADRQLNRTKYF